MDSTVVFVFATFALTTMLVAIGVQVFIVLREFQRTLQKTNKILDDTGLISESVSKPISTLSSTLLGLKGGAEIVKLLTRKRTKD